MVCHKRNNLVISRPRPAVGIVRAKMQAVNCRACLAVGACGFTASRDELPYKGLGGNPFLIIASLEIAAVALITVKQGKPDSLFLVSG